MATTIRALLRFWSGSNQRSITISWPTRPFSGHFRIGSSSRLASMGDISQRAGGTAENVRTTASESECVYTQMSVEHDECHGTFSNHHILNHRRETAKSRSCRRWLTRWISVMCVVQCVWHRIPPCSLHRHRFELTGSSRSSRNSTGAKDTGVWERSKAAPKAQKCV